MMRNSIKKLDDEQAKLLPTPEQVADYERKGWHITPKIIDDETLQAARAGAAAFYDGARDYTLESLAGIANDAPNADATLLNNEFVTLQSEALRQLGHASIVAATAARLARADDIRLFADSLISKRPEKPGTPGIVGWHTDRAYWPTCSSDLMLTAWIPLQDVTVDMGPMVYIEGSHHWRDDPELSQFYGFNNQDLSGMQAYLAENAPDAPRVETVIKAGQVAFHNAHVIHSSRPNSSQNTRLALAVHLQDGANHNIKALRPDGSEILIGYDKLCRKDDNGRPDYSDPDLFPVLYHEGSA